HVDGSHVKSEAERQRTVQHIETAIERRISEVRPVYQLGYPICISETLQTSLRSVKRETLKLIETFLDKAEDQPQIGKQRVPLMTDLVLGDYARNVPDAKESEFFLFSPPL
ncbi:protein exportin 1A, partial [Tanacetum coccineum]